MSTPPPLIAHVVHRLDFGGLENGVVNLINGLPPDRYRHAVIALTEVGAIARRIRRADVQTIALHRPPGPLLLQTPRLARLFRRLRPAIVHTRNVGTLEAQLAAAIAGVRVRVHGEHGWEVHDLGTGSEPLLRVRRRRRRLVGLQVALSRPTAAYLRDRVGVPEDRIVPIYNGVDAARFAPRPGTARPAPPGAPDWPQDAIAFGTVGRQQDVKHPLLLVEAFVRLRASRPDLRPRLRLALVGDGPLAAAVREALRAADALDVAWLPGARDDVAALYPMLDVFVLPSLAEGLCNTLLEAMACGLPCVATDVGGNGEIVEDGVTGTLVASDDVAALQAAMARLADDRALAVRMGEAGRRRVLERFSLDAMIDAYDAMYRRALAARG